MCLLIHIILFNNILCESYNNNYLVNDINNHLNRQLLCKELSILKKKNIFLK